MKTFEEIKEILQRHKEELRKEEGIKRLTLLLKRL